MRYVLKLCMKMISKTPPIIVNIMNNRNATILKILRVKLFDRKVLCQTWALNYFQS